MGFVIACANLRAKIYGVERPAGEACRDPALFAELLKAVEIPEWAPKAGYKVAVTEEEEKKQQEARAASMELEDDDTVIEAIVAQLGPPGTGAACGEKLTVTPEEFEKDVSTRILGRRTAPFPPFLIPYRVPHGFTPRS